MKHGQQDRAPVSGKKEDSHVAATKLDALKAAFEGEEPPYSITRSVVETMQARTTVALKIRSG